jgi:hypothetical protein
LAHCILLLGRPGRRDIPVRLNPRHYWRQRLSSTAVGPRVCGIGPRRVTCGRLSPDLDGLSGGRRSPDHRIRRRSRRCHRFGRQGGTAVADPKVKSVVAIPGWELDRAESFPGSVSSTPGRCSAGPRTAHHAGRPHTHTVLRAATAIEIHGLRARAPIRPKGSDEGLRAMRLGTKAS